MSFYLSSAKKRGNMQRVNLVLRFSWKTWGRVANMSDIILRMNFVRVMFFNASMWPRFVGNKVRVLRKFFFEEMNPQMGIQSCFVECSAGSVP